MLERPLDSLRHAVLCPVRLVGQYQKLASASRYNCATGEECRSAQFRRSRDGARFTANMPCLLQLQPCFRHLQGCSTIPEDCNSNCPDCSGLSFKDSTCKMAQVCERQGLRTAVACMCTFACKEEVVMEALQELNPGHAFWKCTAGEKLPRYICMRNIPWSVQLDRLPSDSCA